MSQLFCKGFARHELLTEAVIKTFFSNLSVIFCQKQQPFNHYNRLIKHIYFSRRKTDLFDEQIRLSPQTLFAINIKQIIIIRHFLRRCPCQTDVSNQMAAYE